MLRLVWQVGFCVWWMLVCFAACFPPMLLVPSRGNRLRMAHLFSRWWSLGCFWAAGVRVEVVSGREHLATRPAVFLFNHSSNLDFLVNAVVTPFETLVFGKYELSRIPFLGWIWWLSGHPMIKRSERDHWEAKLDEVARLLATGRYSTVIAPEGKRNHDGRLLPFKKGPFHLAMGSRARLVPWVIEGGERLLGPRGILPGTIRVRVLAPIDTATWTAETLDARIAEVRKLYLDALGQVDA